MCISRPSAHQFAVLVPTHSISKLDEFAPVLASMGWSLRDGSVRAVGGSILLDDCERAAETERHDPKTLHKEKGKSEKETGDGSLVSPSMSNGLRNEQNINAEDW